MTEYDWHETYTTAVEQFGGDTPSAQLEADLINVFTERPEDVRQAIDKIGGAYRAGKVQSPWGALKSEIERIRNRPRIRARAGKTTAKARQRGEQWLRNAGLYCPGWGEARDALINDLHLDEQTADQLEPLYVELQPVGARVEREAEDRARRWIAWAKEMHAKNSAAGGVSDTPAGPTTGRTDPALPGEAAAEPAAAAAYDPGDDL